MILTFFLQCFNCFGEVILSPLIYFYKKYLSERKLIKTKILVSLFDTKSNMKNREIPNSLRGSLSCLGFRGFQNGNTIKYDMHGWSMYNIPNWNLGCYKRHGNGDDIAVVALGCGWHWEGERRVCEGEREIFGCWQGREGGAWSYPTSGVGWLWWVQALGGISFFSFLFLFFI